jgi:uncharacterized OB-fold protein
MAERRPERVRGPRHDEFWAWCDKGELRLQSCGVCGHITWPVVKACEHCGSAGLAWKPMSGRGRIASWCVFHQDYYGGVIPPPYDTILVELEEGPMFVSNPLGMSAPETAIGQPVKVAFIDCEDEAGPFRLPVFEKA